MNLRFGLNTPPPMPYWCRDCKSYFSVRTGTSLQDSRLPLRKWVFAIYLYVTHLKGVSSMKLHRDLKVTQKMYSSLPRVPPSLVRR